MSKDFPAGVDSRTDFYIDGHLFERRLKHTDDLSISSDNSTRCSGWRRSGWRVRTGGALQEQSVATVTAEPALGAEFGAECWCGKMKRARSKSAIASRACGFAKSSALLQRGARKGGLPLPPPPQNRAPPSFWRQRRFQDMMTPAFSSVG